MTVAIKVEKDGQVSETTLSQESIQQFKGYGVDLVEDTKQYLLKLTDMKIRRNLGNLNAEPVYTITGNE